MEGWRSADVAAYAASSFRVRAEGCPTHSAPLEAHWDCCAAIMNVDQVLLIGRTAAASQCRSAPSRIADWNPVHFRNLALSQVRGSAVGRADLALCRVVRVLR